MIINGSFTGEYDATVNSVSKLVRMFIESGELRDRFDVFDKPEVPYGNAYEISVILGADNKVVSGKRTATEHAKYAVNGQSLLFSTKVDGQYARTLDEDKIRACMTDDAKKEEYAAEVVQSLYQGWIRDKNAAVANAANTIITNGLHSASVTVGTDTSKYATDMITAAKTWVENLHEGIKGTEYNNSTVGSNVIAAHDVVLVMSNAMAALLDTNGYAKAFNEQYLSLGDVRRVSSNKIADDVILVTDARNVQVRKRWEKLVGPIQNADGSYNMIYNKSEFIEAAIDTSNTVAFPFITIKGVAE